MNEFLKDVGKKTPYIAICQLSFALLAATVGFSFTELTGTKIDARETATQFCVVEIQIDLKYMGLAFWTIKAQSRRTCKHRVQTTQTD